MIIMIIMTVSMAMAVRLEAWAKFPSFCTRWYRTAAFTQVIILIVIIMIIIMDMAARLEAWAKDFTASAPGGTELLHLLR
jgi:hypothetical protein